MSQPTGWSAIARSHLERHRPRQFAELQAAGELDLTCERMAENAREMYACLVSAGMPTFDAKEMAMRDYIYLPQEAGVEDDEDDEY